MEVKVCKNCKRLFKYVYGPELCQECTRLIPPEEKEKINKELHATLRPMVREDEEKYEKVKDYIMIYPKATIIQISDANDISAMKLFEWIREDRLEFSEESKYAWFECASCGIKIKSGRLCYKCKVRY